MDSVVESVPLGYAPSHGRLRRTLRRTAVSFGAVFLGVAIYHWGLPVWTHVELLYWQRQCIVNQVAAGTVVYETDPAKAKRLLSLPGYVDLGTSNSGRPQAAYFRPPQWDRYASLCGFDSAFFTRGAIVFLGELQAPSGQHFVVAVSHFEWGLGTRLGLGVVMNGVTDHYRAMIPATAWRRAQPARDGAPTPEIIPIPASPSPVTRERFYAGQIDPGDPSHFTVQYEAWGQKDIIDGRVDNSGFVTLRQRHPPSPPDNPPR